MEYLQLVIAKVLISIAVVGVIGVFLRLYNALVVKPEKLRSLLRKQGINGPPPAFLLGNIMEIKKARSSSSSSAPKTAPGQPPARHDCAAVLFPFFDKWRKQYGDIFAFSLGNTQIIHVNQPDVVREITTCTSLDLGKPSYQFKERGPLMGGMINLINESTETLLKSWKNKVDAAGGVASINIDQHMRSFSGDVISRACFGSNFAKGEEIFHKLRALQEAMSKKVLSTGIPGMRYLPTKTNREAWALEKEVRSLILQVVKERMEAAYEKDLLQMLLEGAKNSDLSQEAMDRFIVDNCKNIYLAGYETTAVSATWCLMLLASSQEWQNRVRAEVLEVCGDRLPDADVIRKMKLLTMVINESLRLYSPVPVVSREALTDMKFGDLQVPEGVNVWTMVFTLHTDPEIWGPDSYSFNPGRFANGITGACKLPHLYMPFGVGPRVCLGQNLAMVELKILIAQLLSNFSFTLSPNYIHSPALRLVIEPEHGVELSVTKLSRD
ncbi:hypothetical protein EUGRSUZ_B04030 [Eucalyptus grandis]|uniref:Uncharacterized protein n=2 Tax=Eucalyptus grandis TaxID=71139 RepID=A0ACC3LXZ9_EUCGR|nr:hypothetical protein EUGRSUZ_B04030 [Eucalyptus grandis]